MEVRKVESTNLDVVAYESSDMDVDSGNLYVKFKNQKEGYCYRYGDISRELWESFINSESKGSFFQKNIRGRQFTLLVNMDLINNEPLADRY